MSNPNQKPEPQKPTTPSASSAQKDKPKIAQNPTGVIRFSEDYDSERPIRNVKKK